MIEALTETEQLENYLFEIPHMLPISHNMHGLQLNEVVYYSINSLPSCQYEPLKALCKMYITVFFILFMSDFEFLELRFMPDFNEAFVELKLRLQLFLLQLVALCDLLHDQVRPNCRLVSNQLPQLKTNSLLSKS